MKQFIKFGIVGCSNTILSYIIYIICLSRFQKYSVFSEYDYIVSSVIAFLLSVMWSFYWNNKFTFRPEYDNQADLWKALIKTYVSYSFTGLLLNNILLYFIVNFINISKSVAPIITLIVTVPLNFILNKLWVWRKENK